nr:copia protein [Tanacetum cinerariifolium]
MVEKSNLDEDLQGKTVDFTQYRDMIGSLMYLTSSRPDLIYAVFLCARYQAKPTKKHLNMVKRIFRYLKGTINMGLWYSKDIDDLLSFTKELGYSGNCEMISTIRTDQMHQPWRTFAAVINKCISMKTIGLDRLRESQAQILWAMYNQINVDYVALLWEDFMYQSDNKEISSVRKEHMPYPRFTKVIINHFISKDNTISMRNRINLHIVRDDTLLDIKESKAYKNYLNYATGKVPPKNARKFKKLASPKLKTSLSLPNVLAKKSKRVKRPTNSLRHQGPVKRETHKLLASGSSEGADFESKVPDEPTGKPKGTSEGTEQDEEYMHTLEKDKSNNEETMYEEEDDDVVKELYGDLNITQGLRDTDMTNAEQGGEDQQNASHKSGFKQEEDDGHVMLTTIHDKTEGTMQSSSVSSDFTSKLLNLDNTGPDVNEIASLMNTSIDPPPPLPVNPSSHLTTISQQQTPDSTTKITNKTMTLPEIPNFTSLFQFDQKGIRPRDEKRNSSKDAEPSKGSKSSSSSKGTQSQPKSLSKSTQAEEPKFNTTDTEMQQDQGNESGHIDDQLDNEAAPKHDWFQKLSKPQTPDHAWNKSKSVDFRLPQKWISTITKARQPPHTFNELMGTPIDFSAYVMNLPVDYFINNDLEYLKGRSLSSKYATSTIRTKAAKYNNIEGIEDMVPTLWSSKSPHNVYSKRRIIAVTNVKVMRWYDYGYLEEIIVRRDDKVLYKFKEGNFPRLNLRDIEEMLLLLVQKKLSNLDVDDRYDLGVALRMFTRRIVILHRVEYLQLGVLSYQKKHNITRPETTKSNISKLTLYTAYKNPQGII